MYVLLDFISRVLKPRHKDWRQDGSFLRMKRWNGASWEYREMTPGEKAHAEWMQAVR